MMKINKIKTSKKKLFIPVILALILASAGTLAMYHYKVGLFHSEKIATDEKIDLNKPSDDQVDAGTVAKNDFSSRPTEASKERQAASGDTKSSSEDESVQTIISSANINGGTLSIRSILQTIDASGTCTLTLSRAGSQSISKTASTNTMGSYTTCAGFDVDISGMAKGQWEIKLLYTGSSSQSGSATKMVTL